MHLNVSISWIYSKTVKRRTLESDIWIRILTLPFGFVTQAKSFNSDEPSIPILKTTEIVCNYHPHPHPQQHHVSIATTHSKSQGEQTLYGLCHPNQKILSWGFLPFLTSYLALVYISVISFISSSCFSFFYPTTTPYSQILGILRTLPSRLNLTPGTHHVVVCNRPFIHYILLRYIHAPKHILLGDAWYLKWS